MRLNLNETQKEIIKMYFKKLDKALGIEPKTPDHLIKSFNEKLEKLTGEK